MALAPGSRLGPYEVISPLGAGGMGEVYKARDTRLGRTVAIKVLAPALSEDPAFRARFDREAQTISRLSNSHICTLYDVGKDGGVDYLVLEFLEGETLAELCRKGPVAPARAIALGLEICDALAAAHRAGVLHRDLKPGNVMLTPSGVKLLDFGLAKASVEAAGVSTPHTAATVTTPLTARGTILGTSQYMAPEQYEGRAADARSDIWAFGCVLYEMIAGQRPFDGETTASIIGAIVSSEPAPLPALAPGVSPAIERVIRGSLEKDPEARWQDIRDVRRALQAASGDAGVATPVPGSRRKVGWLAAALGALLLIAVAALAMNWKREAPASLVRFDFHIPPPAEIQRFNDIYQYFAVSPDGRRVVIASVGGSPPGSLWIKAVDAPAAQMIAGTSGATGPFWSPDGRSIGFFADGTLKRVALDGGSPKTLCPVGGVSWNGAWSSTGTILIAEWGAQRLMRVSEEGGQPVRVLSGRMPQAWPRFLPDGRRFLFNEIDLTTSTIRAFVGTLDSAEVKPIEGVSSRMEYVAGRLVFWRDGSLIAQAFDIDRARLTGTPNTLADHVHGFAITGFAAFSASAGTLVYQAGVSTGRLEWLDRQGRPLGSVGTAADYVGVQLSPDGSSIAYAARDPDLGTNDIYVFDLQRNADRRLVTDRRTENPPIWTPDGQTVIYAADRTGPPNLFALAVNRAGEPRSLVPPGIGGPQRPYSITRDGKFVLYTHNQGATGNDILMSPLDGSGTVTPIVQTKAQEGQPHLSADGEWLAYVSDESGRTEVYVQRLRDPSTRRQVSPSGGTAPRWRRDGGEIFFLTGGRALVWAVDVTRSGADPVPGIPHLLFTAYRRLTDYDVTADGQRFLLAPDAPREAGALSAVLNWQALLR
jgi:eukaryotic-like serine/threonine-protein kinase